MEAWSYAQYAGETESERERERENNSITKNSNSMFCTCLCVCSMHTFIQVLTRSDRSAIVLQCSLRAPTLTPKYIPSGISSFAPLRHSVLCAEPAYPIGPNRLGTRYSVLGLTDRSLPTRYSSSSADGPRLLQPTRLMLSLYLNTPLFRGENTIVRLVHRGIT